MNGRHAIAAAAVLAIAGTVWWQWPVEEPAAAPTRAAPPMVAETVATVAAVPPPAVASSASSAAPVTKDPFDSESAADLQRKVQLGFGGRPDEALAAAHALQACAHAVGATEAMFTTRDNLSILPAAVRKLLASFGGVTNDQIARAQRQESRCQVFDSATLARRGELFQKAYEGGAPGAAMAYLTWLTYDGKEGADPAVVQGLQADVRKSAQGGDFGTLASFAFLTDAKPFGANPAEGEAYRQAWLRIVDEANPGSAASSREVIAKLQQISPTSPLTEAQQLEVKALAQQVYEAYRRRQNGG
ncbi:hypothetical protein [Ideonella sp. YS5]|uniref:hypothetical protein n=1 Tax=Ideonella sp. YS5 TaxID=3453714 RepID=UPI003EEA7AD1